MSGKIIDQIKGHSAIKAQLFQALSADRLARAFLFSGPSGVGKRKMALALAQALLCEEAGSPCGACRSCAAVEKGQSEHILPVLYETLQIRLGDVQAIPPFLSLQSFAKAKAVLIDEAEKLNPPASAFLLKIIEEPPPKSFFFLISSAPSRLSLTLRSRLQNVRFSALPESLVEELSPKGSPQWMIRGSRGRMDLFEDLRDQESARNGAFNLWADIFKGSSSVLAMDFPQKIGDRKEALALNRFFQQILRDARFLQMGREDDLIHGDKKEELEKLSRLPRALLDLWIKKALEMERDLRANADYSLCFENFALSAREGLRDK